MEFEVKWVDKKNIKEINKLSSKTQNTDFNDYLDITIFYNEKKCSIKNNNTNNNTFAIMQPFFHCGSYQV